MLLKGFYNQTIVSLNKIDLPLATPLKGETWEETLEALKDEIVPLL
jgi:hypothetical protein